MYDDRWFVLTTIIYWLFDLKQVELKKYAANTFKIFYDHFILHWLYGLNMTNMKIWLYMILSQDLQPIGKWDQFFLLFWYNQKWINAEEDHKPDTLLLQIWMKRIISEWKQYVSQTLYISSFDNSKLNLINTKDERYDFWWPFHFFRSYFTKFILKQEHNLSLWK